MQGDSALDRAVAMVADLRVRCDWDRIQTRRSLRPYLIEEAHELAAALGEDDPAAIREEVADLMLHLAWQLVLGLETGEFTPDQVAAKMRRRHPHLFELGERERWETLKRRERNQPRGILDGLPATLPELLMAYRLQERAATVGFDWPDTNGPLAKVHEELAEVEAELAGGDSKARLEEELGDLLFAVVNLTRKAGVQPGAALDRANGKFRKRFESLEREAERQNIDLGNATLEELDVIWEQVKTHEGPP
ncbi:MAG TPA: nucleoside triphosphate pyrophosphohydrolase [Gemmatimonadales bacterium]|nr:nucleoside triphosphate pyrophosphohydrolase [Gemmatimonadales bacterium]